MIKKRGRPPKNAVKSEDAPKRAYTKRAKSDDVVEKKEETTVQEGFQVKPSVEIVVEPSDNLEDAIAEIWDAFVLRIILNPKYFGDRQMEVFKKYKDVANSIIASKKEEVAEATE